MPSSVCRLLGIVSSEPTEFRIVLKEAPRSMAALSKDHPDGWGLAVWSGGATGAPGETDGNGGWRLSKGIQRAHDDDEFHRLAVGSRGELLVAHIRQKTVGALSIENTHPFHAGRWVFAHNGTIKDIGFLKERTSKERSAQVRGQTDSELFFAYLLTHLDERGLTDQRATRETDLAVRDLAKEARERSDFGAFNFLLSDGDTIYAHRFGRTLCLLERGPHDEVRPVRSSRDGTIIETPWSQRRRAILIASEHLTAEPWQTIGDGLLLRIDRVPQPMWRLVA
jgi:predicted glutamine amidotransferase